MTPGCRQAGKDLILALPIPPVSPFQGTREPLLRAPPRAPGPAPASFTGQPGCRSFAGAPGPCTWAGCSPRPSPPGLGSDSRACWLGENQPGSWGAGGGRRLSSPPTVSGEEGGSRSGAHGRHQAALPSGVGGRCGQAGEALGSPRASRDLALQGTCLPGWVGRAPGRALGGSRAGAGGHGSPSSVRAPSCTRRRARATPRAASCRAVLQKGLKGCG